MKETKTRLISRPDGPHSRRSRDALIKHYLVEKDIAQRIKQAKKGERKKLYAVMYEELFSNVPDHPRLVSVKTPAQVQKSIEKKYRLLRPYLSESVLLVEFGAGDCIFASTVSEMVRKVYAIDVSDQAAFPINREKLELLIYDGCEVALPDAIADIVFSDFVVEHIHPDEVQQHFRLVHRLLEKGGFYIFRTEHKVTGPHDISRFFCEEAQGFHLKEWTIRELSRLAKETGFESTKCLWYAKGIRISVPYLVFLVVEELLARLPLGLRRKVGRYLLPNITMVVTK